HREVSGMSSDAVQQSLLASSHREAARQPVQSSERLQRPEDVSEFPLFPMQSRFFEELGPDDPIEVRIEPIDRIAQLVEPHHGSAPASILSRRRAAAALCPPAR